MSGIDNHDRNEYITTAEALALFRKLQLEEQNQRDEGLHGAELPLEISEYLDGTPAYELKEEFKRFKRQIAKYKNDNWNRPEQINKELIPELKKWKIDTFQVVSSIYKYSDNTRAQARASTEIYTQLQYLQQKVHFDNDEDREIFEGAPLTKQQNWQPSVLDKPSSKTMTLRSLPPKPLEYQQVSNIWKKPKMKTVLVTHLTKNSLPNYTKNDFNNDSSVATINNNKPKADRLEEEDIEETNAVTPDRSRDHLEEIFTKEGKVVGTISPLPATPTIPPTPINKLRSVWATEDSANLCTITTNSTTFTTTNTTNKTKTTSTTNTTNTTTTTELLRSPGWNSSGGPFSPILQKLGEDRTTPMAIEDHQGGVPHSICQITQPMAIDENGNSLKGTRRNKLSGTKIFNRRNHRRRSRPKIKRIPVKILYPTGSNQETPNPGLSQDQSLYTGRTFQNGRRPGSTRSYRTWRFHGKARFTRRVHSNSYPPCFKTIFSLRKPRKALPIQVTQFWFKRRTQNILQNSSLCNRTVKKTGYPARLLSGRYLYPITRRSRISKDSQEGNQPSRVTRFHHQPKEKLTYTISRTRISGIRIQHQIDADQGPRSQDPQLDATIETSITTNNEVVSLGGQLTREDHGNVTSGGRSPIAYQTFTEVLIQEPTSTSLQLGKPMPIVPQAIEELQWWQIFLTKKNGLPIHRIQLKKPQITITTDSSDTGWGVNSNFIQTYGFWTAAEKTLSINVRELMGIYFALKLHGPNFRNCTIKVLTDNKTSIKYTTKAGGTASVHLQDYAVKIQDLCNMYNLNVIYQHIKGVDNVEADQLSRTKKPLYESTIPKRFFRTIQSLWGPLDIDMFASRQNTQLPRYWSLRPDPQAMATDAFLQQWPMTGLYAYPPWKLIPPVLRLIKKKRIRRIVLVTPWWPTQFWFRCCWE
ncbi:hypothetical protein G6F38_011997 [Rhizopus arrhizus]|nr:hypothetical protein G6F38_011997 [Rhizopus arrhizus]